MSFDDLVFLDLMIVIVIVMELVLLVVCVVGCVVEDGWIEVFVLL